MCRVRSHAVPKEFIYTCVCLCACVNACMCTRACECVCVHVYGLCVCVCVCLRVMKGKKHKDKLVEHVVNSQQEVIHGNEVCNDLVNKNAKVSCALIKHSIIQCVFNLFHRASREHKL